MADLLPSTPDLSAVEEAEPRVIGVDSDDADDLISALSAGTARELLSALHDEPANPAALADRVDTSLQNAQYHLSNLEDAGLVEVVDTVYSEKGREMNVYAPSDRPLVVYAGTEDETTGLQAALARLLGALGVLALASAVVETLFGDRAGTFFFGSGGAGDVPGGGDDAAAPGDADHGANATDTPEAVEAEGGGTATPTPSDAATETVTPAPTDTSTSSATETATPSPTETPTPEVLDAPREAAPGAVDAAAGLPPGLLFFAGGATVLALAFLWYYRADLLAAIGNTRPGR